MSKRLYTAGKGKRGMECIDLSICILSNFEGIFGKLLGLVRPSMNVKNIEKYT